MHKNQNMRPTREEILKVVEVINTGAWLDPSDDELSYWHCDVYNEKGTYGGNGVGRSQGEAAAYAVIHTLAPDALIDNHVGAIDLDKINDGWSFKYTAPGQEWTHPLKRA